MLHPSRLPPLLLVVVGGALVAAAVVAEAVLRAVGADPGWPSWAPLASHLAAAGALATGSWWAAVGWSRRTAVTAPPPPDPAHAPRTGADRQ